MIEKLRRCLDSQFASLPLSTPTLSSRGDNHVHLEKLQVFQQLIPFSGNTRKEVKRHQLDFVP